ncbi:hypothetical protein PVAP13_8NG250000 [Panicum virgatum]|uniref:Uncharacterized protein n=1 Tax=Panicum virgatum TaxID=38727 RepID=A0A8T0P8M0_PANVG|nr:hypothetical protein PVAP13_8NG250000 [Panicum virgatum]
MSCYPRSFLCDLSCPLPSIGAAACWRRPSPSYFCRCRPTSHGRHPHDLTATRVPAGAAPHLPRLGATPCWRRPSPPLAWFPAGAAPTLPRRGSLLARPRPTSPRPLTSAPFSQTPSPSPTAGRPSPPTLSCVVLLPAQDG